MLSLLIITIIVGHNAICIIHEFEKCQRQIEIIKRDFVIILLLYINKIYYNMCLSDEKKN